MVFIWCLFILASASVIELNDGGTYIVESLSDYGSQDMFKFYIKEITLDDLTVSLTTYSDYSDPDMLLRMGSEPTSDYYDYSSYAWGSGSIVIPPNEIKPNQYCYIMVVCYSYCRYGITVSYASEIILQESIPIDGALNIGKQAIYIYTPGPKSDNTLKITVSQLSGHADMYVSIGKDSEPTSDNSELIDYKWDGSLEFSSSNFESSDVFKIAIMAYDLITYTILAKSSNANATMLQESVPIQGEVSTGAFAFYYISILSPNDTVSISLTMFSGDGDIYVRSGAMPSLTQYNFSSVHMGNENLVISGIDRKRIGSPTGKYYIGIYGYQHASFILIVKTSNTSVIELQSGIPQSGSVNQSLFEYYSLNFPSEDTSIIISFSVGSGNPDLYVRLCKQNLTKCFFTQNDLKNPVDIYSSIHLTGSESVEIPHLASSCPKSVQCAYLVGVYGVASYSTFTIVATTNKSDEIILREGRPTSNHLSENDYKYYKFTVINSTVYEVLFMLTPTYGDCDIYTCFNSLCSIENYDLFDKLSFNGGVEVDQVRYIRGVDSDSLTGTYHIMVFANEDTFFSIVAKESVPGKNSTIQIYPGHPQKDTIFNDPDRNYRIYFFPIHFTEETKQNIIITLSAITGNFSLYVANQLSNLDWKKEIFYYNWRNDVTNYSDPYYIINISPDDIWYKLDSTYLILVMGESYLADNTSTYVVGFTCGDANMILNEDVPITGVVMQNEYNYYTFPIHYKHEDVTISITALTGDPDMYISVDPLNPNPTYLEYDFISTTFGSEYITLVWEQGLKDKCPDMPDDYNFGDKTECNVYIGVHGFETSTYIIRVHPGKNMPMVLTLGQPINSNVNISSYNFYYTMVDTKIDVHVYLLPMIGDSDLFVNVIDSKKESDSTKWERPTREKSDYASQSSVMSEEIDISPKILENYCSSGTCIILSSVFCYSEVCTYSISVRQTEMQMLIENQATYGSVDIGYLYYSYYCDKESTNFLITVTSFGDGNPDMYISKGRDTRPNINSFVWYSNSWGGDSIMITSDDSYFEGKSMKGTYVIGITSEWGPSSFSIMVNNNPRPVISLISGVPQYGNATGAFNYYSFYNVIPQDITISITPTSGAGKFYANSYYDWGGDRYSSLPNNENNYWSSTKTRERYSLTINTTDPWFCTYCEIIIGIIADEGTFVYSITATNSMNITILQNGVVAKGEAPTDKWSVYSFEVLKSVDIDISVAPFSGHPNIYVSTSKDWTWESYGWMEYYAEDAITISINKNDPLFKVGTYYIIIQSYEFTTFSIVAHTREVPVSLVDGWPVSYALKMERNEYVQMRLIATRGRQVFCTLKGLGDFRPRVYAKFQEPFTKYENAGPTSFTKSYNESDYQEDYRQLTFSLTHDDGKTQLDLGIYSYQSLSEDYIGKFQISCSSSTQTTILRVGAMHIEMLDKDVIQRRYEMVTPSKGTLDAYVIPCIGDFKLEISSNWTLVMQETSDVAVSRMTDGIISGTINNADGRYYISVSSIDPSIPGAQIYELLSVFTKRGDPILKKLNPGKNGLLLWERKEKKNIIISWYPLENDTTPVKDSGAEYKVYFTKTKHTSMVTACGIHFYQSRGEVKYLGSTTETNIEVKLPDEKGFINIIAILPKSSTSPIKEIVYDPTEVLISDGPPNGGGGLLIFWILATLLFIAVVTSIYFYKKKKRIENVLNYEMSDVRNVASVTQYVSESPRKDPYAPLSNIN
ncbi:hypothetical protein SteCoe_9537 [Stentor coeruleus]|uniref:Uncharacterized protein n=1 Tax=Stentor coeruleus TaxID=5963 RepID=A0A1R2CHN3_9CILI|nr:hypothetical protein SteCoe_9537 [Stentor coeruleus]